MKTHLKIFSFTLLMLLLTQVAFGQDVVLDLQNPGVHREADICSFAPAILLKHTISPFYKSMKNPVFTPSKDDWDSKDVADPFILNLPADIYLFYDGDGAEEKYGIGYARLSNDGWEWERKGPLLMPQENSLDAHDVVDPVVVPVQGKFLMYYSGNEEDSTVGYGLGIAESVDLQNWERIADSASVFSNKTGWDISGQNYVDVMYNPFRKLFQMWYSGFSGPLSSIGYAESKNGVNWQRRDAAVYSALPGVIAPEVVYNGETYFMYYVQSGVSKGLKTSVNRVKSWDGLNWSSPETVIRPEHKWEGRRLMDPEIAFIDQKVRLFYCAQKSSRWVIGEAYAIPTFVKSGSWQSDPINEKFSKIEIIFEKPPKCDLDVLWNDQKMKVSAKNELPYKRIRAIFDLPANPGKLTLNFTTAKNDKSPVIYQVKLLK